MWCFIHLSANSTGDALVVHSFNDNHNHEIHKVITILLSSSSIAYFPMLDYASTFKTFISSSGGSEGISALFSII